MRVFALVCFLVAGSLCAETLLLKSGARVEGTIISQNRTTVTIRTAGGDQTFRKDAIRRIQYGQTAAEKEAEKAAAEKRAAEKAEADRIASEKAEAERISAEKAEADRIAAEKAAAEKSEAKATTPVEKVEEKPEANTKTPEEMAAEKLAAEKAESDRILAEKQAADKAAAEKAEIDKAASDKANAEKTEADRIAAEKAETERAAADKIAAEKAAAEKAAADRKAKEEALARVPPFYGAAIYLAGEKGISSPAFLEHLTAISLTREPLTNLAYPGSSAVDHTAYAGAVFGFSYIQPRWMVAADLTTYASSPHISETLFVAPQTYGTSTVQMTTFTQDSYKLKNSAAMLLGGYGILPDASAFQTYAIGGLRRESVRGSGKRMAYNVVSDLSTGAFGFSFNLPYSETVAESGLSGLAGVLVRYQMSSGLELHASGLAGAGKGTWNHSLTELRNYTTSSAFETLNESAQIRIKIARAGMGVSYPVLENAFRIVVDVNAEKTTSTYASTYTLLPFGQPFDIVKYYTDQYAVGLAGPSTAANRSIRLGLQICFPESAR